MNWKTELNSATGGIRKVPKLYRALVSAHGSSRKKAVDFICGIGGYYDRHERFAVEWNVKTYYCDLDIDPLYSNPARDEFPHLHRLCTNDGQRGILYNYFSAQHRWVSHRLWDFSVQEVWESFANDEGTFWGSKRDGSFTLRGRCSGHLVLEECANISLRCSEDELRSCLMERTSYDGRFGEFEVPDSAVVTLFLLCVQITQDWNPRTVSKEVDRHAAYFVWSRLSSDKLGELLSAYYGASEIAECLNAEGLVSDDEAHARSVAAELLGYPKKED